MTIDPFRILCCQGKEEKKGQQKEREGEEKAELSELFYRKFILALE